MGRTGSALSRLCRSILELTLELGNIPMPTIILNQDEIETLTLRADTYRAELKTCTTRAMRLCVIETLDGVLARLSRSRAAQLELDNA